MAFTIILDYRAIQDVQDVIDFYEEQQPRLGRQFEQALHEHLLTLELNPFFQIRYDNIRCLPLRKFPYMIHFTVDEEVQQVVVWAVLHTSRDPRSWGRRK